MMRSAISPRLATSTRVIGVIGVWERTAGRPGRGLVAAGGDLRVSEEGERTVAEARVECGGGGVDAVHLAHPGRVALALGPDQVGNRHDAVARGDAGAGDEHEAH